MLMFAFFIPILKTMFLLCEAVDDGAPNLWVVAIGWKFGDKSTLHKKSLQNFLGFNRKSWLL